MIRKHTLVAASLGLLFAGHALAGTNGMSDQPGLTGRDAPGDVTHSRVALTTASVDFSGDQPDGLGTYDASGVAPSEAASGAGDPTPRSALRLHDVGVTRVPEPKDWLMMLAGIGLVGMMVERTKRRQV